MDSKLFFREMRTAIKQGDLDKVAQLIDSNKAMLNEMTVFGTWLHQAVEQGQLEIVKLLVDLGIDVNAKGGIAGGSALLRAASDGRLDFVEYLLARGAEMDVSEREQNPLFGAIYGGHTAVAKLLIDHGIDTQVKYGKQTKEMDALACAHAWGRTSIMALLSGEEPVPDAFTRRAAVRRPPKTDVIALRSWLAEPRTALIAAVAQGVREHVATLRARKIDFYGYALLPGEPYDVRSIVAVSNAQADIKVPQSDKMYCYYRYGVDEWAHWHQDGFAAANLLLTEANEHFLSMHAKPDDNCVMDEFEIVHAEILLDSVLSGFQTAKETGAFGSIDPFLVIWISDSDHPIMAKSVRQLNSAAVVEEFTSEFR